MCGGGILIAAHKRARHLPLLLRRLRLRSTRTLHTAGQAGKTERKEETDGHISNSRKFVRREENAIVAAMKTPAVKHEQFATDGNDKGFAWHTTGSGKALTSFKASTLLKENDSIHKCVFVVERKDLDLQTREEFNRFQEGCVEENTNTAAKSRVRHRQKQLLIECANSEFPIFCYNSP
jgi:type I site-specific restriction endonuclease